MPTTKYRVAITHAAGIARVEGLLVKIVKKVKKDPGDPDRFRRVICDFQPAVFTGTGTSADPFRWETVLTLPTGKAKKRVVAYDVEIVVLDASNGLIDGFVRRIKAPPNIVLPPIIVIDIPKIPRFPKPVKGGRKS